MAESQWKASSSAASDDFIVSVERRFEDLIEHLPSPSALAALLPATRGKNLLVISGFPFDEGSYLSQGRIGAEKAPQDLRRCVKEYLQQSIEESLGEALRVIDVGDIPKTAESQQSSTDELLLVLQPPRKKCNELSLHDAQQSQVSRAETLLQALKERQSQRGSAAFFIGGSGDMSHCNWLAMRQVYHHPSQRIGVVSIDSRVDILPPINVGCEAKVHSRSSFYQLLLDARTAADGNSGQTSPTFVSFGAQSSLVSAQDLAKLKSVNADVYFMESHIRRGGVLVSDSTTAATTQAGRVFSEAMKSLEAKVDVIYVSLDMQAIDAAYSPGVSYPNVLGGLTGEEAIDIARVAAQSAKLVMFDVVEYSPAVEQKRTGHLLATILFNFAQALSQQK